MKRDGVAVALLLGCLVLLTTSCGLSTQAAGPQPFTTKMALASSPSREHGGHLTVSANFLKGTVGQSYNAVVSVGGGSPPYQFSTSQGTTPPGLAIDQKTGRVSGVPLVAGSYHFTVFVQDLPKNDSGDHRFNIDIASGEGPVVTVSPTAVTLNSGGTQQFTAYVSGFGNTAVTWSATVGTISTNGFYTAPIIQSLTTATVTATSVADPTLSGSAQVTVIPSNGGGPVITTQSVPPAGTGVPYSTQFAASGGKQPYVWSVSAGALPPGLQLDSAGGSLVGTPTSAGTFGFQITVVDSLQMSDTASFTLLVTTQGACGPPSYSCAVKDNLVHTLTTTAVLGTTTGHAGGAYGAGAIAVDASLASPNGASLIGRLTDTTTGQSNTTLAGANHNVFSQLQPNGRYYVTFSNQYTGSNFMMSFDPAAFRTGTPGWSRVEWRTSGGAFAGNGVQFPRTDPTPYIFTAWSSQPPKLSQYHIDTTQTPNTFVLDSLILDPDNPSCANGVIGAGTWNYRNNYTSADDQRLSVLIGAAQDKDYYVVVFDKSLGCKVFNSISLQLSTGWNNPTWKNPSFTAAALAAVQHTTTQIQQIDSTHATATIGTHQMTTSNNRDHVNVISCGVHHEFEGRAVYLGQGLITSVTGTTVTFLHNGSPGSAFADTCTLWEGRTLHEADIEKSGTYVFTVPPEIASGNTNPVAWNLDMDTFDALPNGIGGHWAPGWKRTYGDSSAGGSTTGGWGDLTNDTYSFPLSFGFNNPNDGHKSSNQLHQQTDANAFLESSYYGSANWNGVITQPYGNELFFINLDNLQLARFAHNFDLGGSVEGLTSVSQISGDGEFAIFGSTFRAFSDLDGTSMATRGFGSSNDPLNCDPTQPTTSPTGCRTDVLLLDLVGGSKLTVTISPASATVNRGATQQFSAAVGIVSDQRVTWTATGGTISSSGRFTAGQTPGSYTVTATSVADPNRSAMANVTVQ